MVITGNGDSATEAVFVAPATQSATGLSERQQLILSGIGADTADVDTIVARTSLPAHVVLQELTFLSLKGQLHRVGGQTYARRKGAAS